MTGSGFMTIFIYKGLSRNPEIGNTLVCVLHNIWRLGQVRDTKFGTNFSNKMLLNAAKYHRQGMKVGRRTFDSSHHIYLRLRRWAMECLSPRWEPRLRTLLNIHDRNFFCKKLQMYHVKTNKKKAI